MIEILPSIVGLLTPPIFNFIKGVFSKNKNDTPQQTLSSLAVTKPDVMPAYIEAQAKLIDAEVRWFNRDVIQQVSSWVMNLRGSIRPFFVVISILTLIIAAIHHLQIDTSTKYLMDLTISSWFGDRLVR